MGEQDAKDRLATSAFKSFDLHHQLARLRYSRNVPRAEVEAIFTTLAKAVKSDVQIIEVRFSVCAWDRSHMRER